MNRETRERMIRNSRICKMCREADIDPKMIICDSCKKRLKKELTK